MDTLTVDSLKALARVRGQTCVSIYMPTAHFSPGSQEGDATRLRNLLRDAERSLAESGMRATEIEALIAPARELLDDRGFWLRSAAGLAVLLGGERPFVFQSPVPFGELAWTGQRFHLKPLLSLLGSERTYWVLALSQKHVRVLRGSQHGLVEVPVEGIPESLAEALRWDDFEKQSLQFHTHTPGSGGRRPAVFHGTGESDPKGGLTRYFRGIDRGLRELLRDTDEPLVLAGVDYLLPLYRDVNTYPHLAEGVVTGNPDSLGEATVRERTWDIVGSLSDAARREVAERIVELWATPRATPDPETIVPAAAHGRVEALFVATDASLWGSFEKSSGRVTTHEQPVNGDEDLLDLAALNTLLGGGSVYAVPAEEVPHGKTAVALLRY